MIETEQNGNKYIIEGSNVNTNGVNHLIRELKINEEQYIAYIRLHMTKEERVDIDTDTIYLYIEEKDIPEWTEIRQLVEEINFILPQD